MQQNSRSSIHLFKFHSAAEHKFSITTSSVQFKARQTDRYGIRVLTPNVGAFQKKLARVGWWNILRFFRKICTILKTRLNLLDQSLVMGAKNSCVGGWRRRGTSFLFSDSPPAPATVHCPLTTTTSNSSRTSSSTSNSASGDGQWRRTCYNRTNKCDKCDKCGVDYSEAMIKVEKDSWYCWLCPSCNLFYPSHLHSFLIPLYCCCQLSSANKLKQRLENLFWKMKLHCVQSLKIRSIDTKSRTHHRVPKYKGFALTFYGASLINVQFTLSRVGGTSLRHHKNCEYCPKLRFTLDNISSEWVTRPLLSNCGEMKGMHLKVWNWVAAKVSDTSSVLWCSVGKCFESGN